MLPEPMLAKSAPLPTSRGWAFEPKFDGFRAIVRTGDDFGVRSRRGWRMTELLPEFQAIPVSGVFDGELISLDRDGRPSFERVSRRMLMRGGSISVSLVLFDVLELEGEDTMRLPYRRRHELLESLDFGEACEVCPRFDNGAALWQVVVERRLEGVVAKRLEEPYRAGERSWVKRKNPDWPRYEAEREAVIRERARRPRGKARLE